MRPLATAELKPYPEATKGPVIGADLSGRVIYLAVTNGTKVLNTLNLDLSVDLLGSFNILQEWLTTLQLELRTHKDIFIEEPWVNGSHFPKAGMMITRTATILEVAAVTCDYRPILVHPGTWRKAIYGNAKQLEYKELARKTVLNMFGYETKHKNQHNTAEAALISHYGWLQN